MDESSKYEAIVLFEGYSKKTERGMLDNCTCTLLRGPKKIVVDTMTAWDGPKLVEALKRHSVDCDDVDFVVCTHGHSDHIGCNYLFQKATHIVGYCVSHRDTYFDHNFNEQPEYVIDSSVKVIATPGHTSEDVSVIVETNDKGIVVVAGDLFENERDLEDDRVWQQMTGYSKEVQAENRKKILELADWIVPGHGPIFKIKK